jgi:hypothetical protein
MKTCLFVLIILNIFLLACKDKDKPGEGDQAISAVSIIKGQLNGLDTSLYQITKIETTNIPDQTQGVPDTTVIRREDIRKFAQPFLSLPDITTDNYSKKYTEEKLIDAEQSTLNITATAKDENAEIQRQIIVAGIADLSSGKVKNIFIERNQPSADSTLEQKLLWEIDRSFMITTIIQKENQPEKVHRVRISWQ